MKTFKVVFCSWFVAFAVACGSGKDEQTEDAIEGANDPGALCVQERCEPELEACADATGCGELFSCGVSCGENSECWNFCAQRTGDAEATALSELLKCYVDRCQRIASDQGVVVNWMLQRVN